jgi:hypothetical protein
MTYRVKISYDLHKPDNLYCSGDLAEDIGSEYTVVSYSSQQRENLDIVIRLATSSSSVD